MKLLITGAKGFIGHHFYNLMANDSTYDSPGYCSTKPIKIYGIDNCSGLACDERDVPYTNGDLMECELPEDVTHVIHLAGRTSVRASWIPENIVKFYRDNFLVSERLFNFYKDKPVKILYATSSSVLEMKSPYAMTKKLVEHIAPPNAIGMRFFTVYGEKGRPDMLYRMAQEGKVGHLTLNKRDFTPVEHVVRCIRKLLVSGNMGDVYEIGTGVTKTPEEFLQHNRIKIPQVSYIQKYDESLNTCANTTKIEELSYM
jgi:nucleoside-diphosphate-sugar epimerase